MGVLDGVRVVDASSGLAAAMAAMVLGDHGAEVVKVEPPGGASLRRHPGSVVWYRGMRSIVCDLALDSDRAVLRDLLATADVFVESFAPGSVPEGLDHGTLGIAHPRLIHCSLTGYGRRHPAADRPARDLLVQARSGQQFEQPGWREGPIYLAAPLPSLAASYLLLEGVSAALYAREVTGRGQLVETSLYQGVLAFTTQLWQRPDNPGPAWWGIPRNPQFGIIECGDGLWVHSMHQAGGRGRDKSGFWRFLGLNEPEDSIDPDHIARVEADIRTAFKRFTRDEVLAAARANDIAMAPVLAAAEGLLDEQVQATGLTIEVVDPDIGPTTQVGPVFSLAACPPALGRGPRPRLDQHGDALLAELQAPSGGGESSTDPSRTPRSPARPLRRALDGVSILDLGSFLAGPFGPMLLGDLGAVVYKLESPDGDQMRNVTMPFNGCQRGKLDVVADLKTPEGVEIAHRLISRVDVVHHNMRPGVAERLGVDYETAKRLNPNVIYCHTTMWGQNGPRRDWPGFDQLGQATSGCEHQLGGEGNPPVWYRFGMCDQACAVQSAIAVLLALYWRERTGQGQFVDTSIIAGGLYLNSDVWLGPDGPPPRPVVDAQQLGIGPLYRLYRTLDGWVALAVLTDEEWTALCSAVPELHADERFATGEDRAVHAAALADVLEAQLASGTSSDWFTRLDAEGVPVEVADADAGSTWFDDPAIVDAGLVADYEHPEYGRLRQFGHLVNLSRTPGRIAGPPPLLGQHSREVLASLGYTPAEMADLRARGITAWPDDRDVSRR
ncbi:MAG: CoA transferase [Acidimicrobiales bacterium]|nr:CoA transferase [Acidimicrobiales bacterium]